jgi:CRISPR-associated protein Csb1
MAKLTFPRISEIVSSCAAMRCRVTLQPGGGEGDKVFPPTYLGAKYATEDRVVTVVNGDVKETKRVPCVLIDSVQSQANRMEDAIQDAIDSERIKVPVIEVDFTGIDLIDPVGKVTSLQAPHRIADAILRDSEHEGVPFRKSELGKQIDNSSNQNATPLFELCPTALVFGVWDSTGPKGGLGAKFARAMVSEIIGFDAQSGVKTGSRIDPLQIRAGAQVIENKDGSWKLATDKAKGAKSPSEVNHGNIPPTIDANTGGVTISRAEQTTVISLPALRRLRFPISGQYKKEYDDAARSVLLALGLVSATLAAERGLDLRSRCLLWPTETLKWEILGKPGETPEIIELTADDAIALYSEAVAAAIQAGVPYRTEPVVLKPSKALTELLQRSQEIAAASGVGEGE